MRSISRREATPARHDLGNALWHIGADGFCRRGPWLARLFRFVRFTRMIGSGLARAGIGLLVGPYGLAARPLGLVFECHLCCLPFGLSYQVTALGLREIIAGLNDG